MKKFTKIRIILRRSITENYASIKIKEEYSGYDLKDGELSPQFEIFSEVKSSHLFVFRKFNGGTLFENLAFE
jgi:hypothetical protein